MKKFSENFVFAKKMTFSEYFFLFKIGFELEFFYKIERLS
jgi:hypothetical protein